MAIEGRDFELMTDARVSPEARVLGLYISAVGGGAITHDVFSDLLGGASRPIVERAIRQLVDAGYIRWAPHPGTRQGGVYGLAQAGDAAPGKAMPWNSRAVPLAVRVAVMERDGARCVECGRDDIPLHLDHIMPYWAGGEHTVDNLRVLCSRCNLRKGGTRP